MYNSLLHWACCLHNYKKMKFIFKLELKSRYYAKTVDTQESLKALQMFWKKEHGLKLSSSCFEWMISKGKAAALVQTQILHYAKVCGFLVINRKGCRGRGCIPDPLAPDKLWQIYGLQIYHLILTTEEECWLTARKASTFSLSHTFVHTYTLP